MPDVEEPRPVTPPPEQPDVRDLDRSDVIGADPPRPRLLEVFLRTILLQNQLDDEEWATSDATDISAGPESPSIVHNEAPSSPALAEDEKRSEGPVKSLDLSSVGRK